MGYEEEEKKLDIEGKEKEKKMEIIKSIELGKKIEEEDIYMEGIRNIQMDEISEDEEIG